MLGRAADRHGSCCGGPPGIDCADYYKGKKAQRYWERHQWQKEEEMQPRIVRSLSMQSNATDPIANHGPHNHAVDARFEGSWVFIRIQEKENGEVFEYAVPADKVSYISFWPEEGTNGG